MRHLVSQSTFQKWPKPEFCYLCGEALQNGKPTNEDHCPPSGLFRIEDRANYSLKLKVHAACNHRWHAVDEKMSVFLDFLHNNGKLTNRSLVDKLNFHDIENEQGCYFGVSNVPLRPITNRILRCAHALLYNEFLPKETVHTAHYPIPELDPQTPGHPHRHEMQTYELANSLCTAQRTGTYDSIVAYNRQFKYICTWSKLDDCTSICIFAIDIYRLSDLAVEIDGFPKAIIGAYCHSRPSNAALCSRLELENSDEDILYPIIES